MENQFFKIKNPGTVKVTNMEWKIILDPDYKDALIGLDGFSHVIVLFWLHLHDTPDFRKTIKCSKPYTKGPDELSIFAARFDYRINPNA